MATEKLSDEQKRSREEAALRYAESVDGVMQYLESRGISKDIAHTRRLGLVTDPIPEHRKMRGRLSIPYLTKAGVAAMAFRCVQDHVCGEVPHGKYMNPSGQITRLYGVNSYFHSGMDIGFAEGELNEITATELCGIPTLGSNGAGKWQPWWKTVLSDFRRIYVFQDGDSGGQQFFDKVSKEMGSKAIAVPFPAKEDVNSFYLKHGAERIREMVYGQ